jgi:hypothetical protein
MLIYMRISHLVAFLQFIWEPVYIVAVLKSDGNGVGGFLQLRWWLHLSIEVNVDVAFAIRLGRIELVFKVFD